MALEFLVSFEEKAILKNTLKTVAYLYEAIQDQDYETASLEHEELKIAFKRLEDMKQKRERRKLLINLVMDMQSRGINIDIARNSSFLQNSAKNTGDSNKNISEIHKKRQQA